MAERPTAAAAVGDLGGLVRRAEGKRKVVGARRGSLLRRPTRRAGRQAERKRRRRPAAEGA